MTLIISYYLSFIIHSQTTFLVLILLCSLGTTTTNSSNLENDRQPFEQHQEIKKLLDYNQKYSSIVNKNLFEYFNRNDNKRYSVSELNANNLKTDVGKFSIINEFHKRNRREIVDERQAATATTANVANKEIFLNLTRILDLSKQNLTQLSELDCLKNAKNVENILMLNVSYNLLTTFNINNLNNFTELSILDLSSNLIEELNLSHSVISEIYLSGNLLRNLTTGDLYNLKYLNLSCNKFNDSKQIVFRNNLTKLEKLDLSWNQLREIHNKLFFNVTNLIELNLSNNQLSELRKNLFYHLQNLEILNLSNNDISQIDNDTFANLPILQYLDLSNNDIQTTSIRSLQGIPELIGLSISGNLLLADHLQGFVESWSIKELDISDIGLCRVPFALAQSVRILNLRGNLLSIIESGDFESYPLLHRLTLSSNRIVAVEEDALGRLEMLTILYLDNNNLTQIPSSLPSSLIKLYLSFNQITDIQPTNLINLVSLETLDLSGNRLLYLPQLPPLHRLITLNLKSCGLKGISQMLVQNSPNIRNLLLDDNPIKCEELYALAEWVSICNEEELREEQFGGESNLSVSNEQSLDDEFEYDATDNEQKERYQNSISYFERVHRGNCFCENSRHRYNTNKKTKQHIVQRLPKCLSEQKLITSLNITNDARQKANDNKFKKKIISSVTKQILNEGNEKDFSNKTSLINNDTNKKSKMILRNNVPRKENTIQQYKDAKSNDFIVEKQKEKNEKQQEDSSFEKRKYSIKAMAKGDNIKISQTSTTSFTVNVKAISTTAESIRKSENYSTGYYYEDIKVEKSENTNGKNNSYKQQMNSKNNNKNTRELENGNKNLLSQANKQKQELQYQQKGLNKSSNNIILMKNKQTNRSQININSSENFKLANENRTNIMNRNLIKINKGNYKIGNNMQIKNQLNSVSKDYVKNNDGNKSINSSNKNMIGGGDDEMKRYGKILNSIDNKNLLSEQNIEFYVNGNTSVVNQTISNQEQEQQPPEKWNDIRIMTESYKHPGLLIVIGISIGVLLTFVLINIYRCNCNLRRHYNIDNFESTRVQSDDILTEQLNYNESHEHEQRSDNNSAIQRDLLPMDILNSTLSQSVDSPNMSLLW